MPCGWPSHRQRLGRPGHDRPSLLQAWRPCAPQAGARTVVVDARGERADPGRRHLRTRQAGLARFGTLGACGEQARFLAVSARNPVIAGEPTELIQTRGHGFGEKVVAHTHGLIQLFSRPTDLCAQLGEKRPRHPASPPAGSPSVCGSVRWYQVRLTAQDVSSSRREVSVV